VEAVVKECPELLRAQEQAVLDLLRAVEGMRTEASGLALLDGTDEPLLGLGNPDKAPLQGRTWELQAYRNRDGIVVRALPEPLMTLRFDDAGRLSGRACDLYRAVYERDGASLRLVGPAAVLRGTCSDEAAAQQGADFVALLSRVEGYRVDAAALLLRDPDGRMLASFTPLPSAQTADEASVAAERGDDNLPPAPMPRRPSRQP
jgi:heat shock protein HslJ